MHLFGDFMFKMLKYLLVGMFAIIFLFAFVQKSNDVQSPNMSSAKTNLGEKKTIDSNAIDSKILSAIIHVKSGMKDPDSFELIEVMVEGENAGCLKFRGKNSFGAKVISSAVVVNIPSSTKYGVVLDEDSQKDYSKNFNQYCARKKLTDKTVEFKYMVKQI